MFYTAVQFKKRRSVLLVLGVFLSAWLHATAIVSGTFKNAAPGEPISLYVPHFYVDNGSDTYRTTLDGQSQFTIAASVPEPQLAFLIHGEDQLPVFLEPDDTLVVRSDLFQFPLAVSFGGRGSANNRLLKEYQPLNLLDFNEFNNIRYKVGQWWFGLEIPVNDTMLALQPLDFRAWADQQKRRTFVLLDDFNARFPGAVTPSMQQWLEAEGVYTWAFHLLMYGSVFNHRYQLPDNFFDFLYESPTVSDAVGSDAYRQFLLVLMARQQAKKEQPERYFAGQFVSAGELLAGKSKAFFQSEIIRMGFSAERYQEILPAYLQFVQSNPFHEFEPKVTSLYEKSVRISPGAPVPAFVAQDAQGRAVSLASLKGRVVYLNFWATWCGACLKKMEVFNAFAPELEAAGVQIVNVSIDQNADSWRTVLQERQFVGIQILATTNAAHQNLARLFNVEAVPQYFLIARNGTFAEKPYSSQPNEVFKRLLELAR